jgi:hypothetical protein
MRASYYKPKFIVVDDGIILDELIQIQAALLLDRVSIWPRMEARGIKTVARSYIF